MKTQALKQALNKYGFTAAFGGGRRDEENLVQKKESSLFRNENQAWDPKNQRPEMWKLYNSKIKKEKAFVYSQSLTGQRQISGNILNAKKLISFHYILQKNAQ